MLSMDVLTQNDVLKALPADTLKIIELMSKNDEAKVLEVKIAENTKTVKSDITRDIYQAIDKDIEEITGKKRDANQKTYAYLKEELGKAWKAVGEVGELKKKVEGGKLDEAKEAQYKQQLKDANNKADQLQSLMDKSKTEYEQKIAGLAKESERQSLQTAFKTEYSQLAFKDNLDENLLKETISNREAKLLKEITTSSIDDDQGGKVTILRGANNQILLNPNNGMKPYTASEFYRHTMNDLLDLGKQQNGGGQNPTPGGGGGGKPSKHKIDLSGVKSQIQFHKAVDLHMAKSGIDRTSHEFGTVQQEIIDANQEVLAGLETRVDGDSNV